MQKMPAFAGPSMLRKVLDDQFSLLAGELVALFEQEVAIREAETRQSLRDDLAEGLNQAVRRLRQADDFAQICGVLVDSSATFCRMLALFSLDGEKVRAERWRGLEDGDSDTFGALEFPVTEAAAFAAAVESGDPVVAMTTPREISSALATVFGHTPEERAFILPIQAGRQPVALMYASGAVEMAPLELLAQAAGLAVEARRKPEAAKKSELVVIQGGTSPERKVPESWAELSAADQEMHLRAQRFARVQVAGMRLFSPELVRQGRASWDLYDLLQKDIDAGRDMFRKTFVEATPNMLDYFHLELVRTLANDDPKLLGEKYPGPLV
jgi:hypothetical protein